MITRHYICDNCQEEFVVQESIKKAPRKKCPSCRKMKLYQDLTGGQSPIIVREPTTLGQQAERNTKAMGKWGLEAQRRKDKQKYQERKLNSLKKLGKIPEDATEIEGHGPWYNPDGVNLSKKLKDIDTNEKATKYILEGKK